MLLQQDIVAGIMFSGYKTGHGIVKNTKITQYGTIEIEYAPERTYDNEKIIKETFYNDIDYISGSQNGLEYLEMYSH